MKTLSVAYQRWMTFGEQRPGQAWWNALYDCFPNYANDIRGTDKDPFYNEGNLGRFFSYLAD
jgi:hypothetical protein